MDKQIDWANLPFGYFPTDYNVRCAFRDGKWGPIEISQSETVNIHMAATTLHYGQEIFEGLLRKSAASDRLVAGGACVVWQLLLEYVYF